MEQEKVVSERVLVITDDLLPFGKTVLRPSGGGGHNGLTSIIELPGTGGPFPDYASALAVSSPGEDRQTMC